MERYKFVFVVLVYRNTDVLDAFFESLINIDSKKVILLDSFSTDEAREKCKTIAERTDSVFLPIPNKGYGAGNNIGIKYAMDHFISDFIIVSNSDIIIRKLDSLDRFAGQECLIAPDTIMFNGKKQNPCQSRIPLLVAIYYWLTKTGYKYNSHFLITASHICSRLNKVLTYLYCGITGKKTIRVFMIHGSFLVFTAAAAKKLWPVYNEKMFLYNEEFYLALKAKKNNIPTFYCRENIVNHLEGASSSGDFWKQYDYYRASFSELEKSIQRGEIANVIF